MRKQLTIGQKTIRKYACLSVTKKTQLLNPWAYVAAQSKMLHKNYFMMRLATTRFHIRMLYTTKKIEHSGLQGL